MPRKPAAKKIQLTKYVSQADEVGYHRLHTYLAHELGNLTVQSSFIMAETAKKTETLGPLEPEDESLHDPLPVDFDTQTDVAGDEDFAEHPRKKKIPSVSAIDSNSPDVSDNPDNQQLHPLLQWLPERSAFLDKFICLEGRGGYLLNTCSCGTDSPP
jgi:hypothetical protein